VSGFTGTPRLVRLALRRDRFVLPAWLLGMAAFLAATTAMFEDSYTRHPELLVPDTLIVVENPGMRVLGLVTGPSVGGYTMHRDGLTLMVLAAVLSVLTVVRHTRQAEELGREEVLASGVVGRYASLAAAVVVAAAADVVLAPLLGLAMVVAGQPVAGSMAAGASIALVGLVFTGVAAITVQLSSTTRGATGTASAVLGVSFLLAALGNMLGTVDSAALRVTSAWPAWLSPIGWGQQVRPYGGDSWWPVGLAVLVAAGLVGIGVVLCGRRDVGSGLWPERTGRARANHALLSPTGLVWRLQRSALVGWAVAMLGFGLVFGALSEQTQDLTGDAAEWYETFGGDVDVLGAYWASMVQIAGTAVAGYVVALVLRLHHDESQGVLEPVLAGSVSRLRWLGAYAVNALVGATLLMLVFAGAMAVTGAAAVGGGTGLAGDLLGAALVQLPAIAALGAVVALVVLVVPRVAVGLSWLLFVLVVMVGPMFGPSLGLPVWVCDLSPFTHVPNAPAVPVEVGPLVLLTVVAGLVAAVAGAALRHRDLSLPA
jgi:polyether ionophore transport system permease protein